MLEGTVGHRVGLEARFLREVEQGGKSGECPDEGRKGCDQSGWWEASASREWAPTCCQQQVTTTQGAERRIRWRRSSQCDGTRYGGGGGEECILTTGEEIELHGLLGEHPHGKIKTITNLLHSSHQEVESLPVTTLPRRKP